VTRLADTVASLDAGELHPWQAQKLSDVVITLTDEQCADVQTRVLTKAAGQSMAAFSRSLARAVMIAAPKTAEQAHTEALSEQHVEVRTLDHGMALLLAWLPAPDAYRIKASITTRANITRVGLQDCRTIDHQRATAFIELIDLGADAAASNMATSGVMASAAAVTPKRSAPAIQVTVSLATLLGLSDHPGELAGYGPIPPAMARALASDPNGTWRRILTDELGRVIDYGRRVYRPPAHLDRFIRARDHICTFPNCHRQAITCELDHVIPWTDAGETNQHNLVAVCARHHHLKHDADWTNHHDPETGTVTWTSPTGHTYTNPPTLHPTAGSEQGADTADPPRFRRAS
jgi:hypothetical protein